MKKFPVQKILGLGFSGIAAFGMITTASAASFQLSPSGGELIQGCSNQVIVYIDASGQSSNAADLEINFNPAEVEIITNNPTNTTFQVKPGDAYEAYIYNHVDSDNGIIKIAAGSSRLHLTSKKIFIAFDFKTKPGITSASFNINFTGSGDTLDSNIAETTTSSDLLTSVTNASYSFKAGVCPQVVFPTVSTTPPNNNSGGGTTIITRDGKTIVVPFEKIIIGSGNTIIVPVETNYNLENFLNFLTGLGLSKHLTDLFTPLNLTGIAASPLAALIFLLPLLTTIFSKNRHYWGVVVDRNSRQAINSATIKLYDKNGNKLIGKQVTDLKGRYGFVLSEGDFRVEASRAGYSAYKEEFKIGHNEEFFSKDLVLDANHNINLVTSGKLFLQRISSLTHKFALVIILGGLIFSGLAIYLVPNFINALTFSIYFLSGLLLLMNSFDYRKNTGKVVDASKKSPVAGAIVKVFSTNSILENTDVTDNQGSFGMKLDAGEYHLRVFANGYPFPANTRIDYQLDKPNTPTDRLIRLDKHL